MLVSRVGSHVDAGYCKMPHAAPEVPRFVRGLFAPFPLQRAPVNTRSSERIERRGFSHSKIPGALKESSSQFEASSLKIRELLLRDAVADPLPPGKLAAR